MPRRRGGIYPYFVCLGRHKRNGYTRKAILIDTVEALVEEHYRTVQPFPGLIDEIRALLFEELAKNRKDAAHERQLLTATVARPEAERGRLLIAYYAGALSLATNWRSAYLACAPRERRQMNPAIFERLDTHADETVDHATSGRSPYCSATNCSEQRPSGIC